MRLCSSPIRRRAAASVPSSSMWTSPASPAKIGMPTANTGMFELTDYQCSRANLLGPEGDGFRIAMGTLVSGRLSVAAGCLGVIEDCLTEAANYAKERQQHGKEIARHQL